MRRSLLTVLVMAFALVARADYLWWTVEESDYSGTVKGDVSDYFLYAQDTAGQATLIDALSANSGGTPKSIDLTAYASGYSFYIELVNYESSAYTPVGQGTTASYVELAAHIASSLTEIPKVTVWHGGPYHAVPEPTSAMLVMLGLALAGLKRRRV